MSAQLGEPTFESDERRFTLSFPIYTDRSVAMNRWRDEVAKMGYEATWGPTVDEIMLEAIQCWGMVKPL